MDTMNNYEIQDRARDKAFAKVAMLQFDIEGLCKDVKNNNTGGITMEELELVLNGTRIEYKVWSFIAKLIETNDREGNK